VPRHLHPLDAPGHWTLVEETAVRGKQLPAAGFHLSELRPGAIDEPRPVKAWIPVIGQDGIPIRDEQELVRDLPGS
jgi:hypothetical protein